MKSNPLSKLWLVLPFLLIPVLAYAAEKRIKDLSTTATAPANDDYMALDGLTKGTRKILANTLAPALTAGTYGNATHTANVTVNADGKVSAVTTTAISAGSGNVTNAATLTSGNIVVGGGTTVVNTSALSVSGNDLTLGAGGIGNLTANVITATTGTITTVNATGATFGGKTLTLAGNLTTVGTSNLTLTTSATSNATVPAGTTTLLSKDTRIVTFILTIDDLADSMNYDVGYVGAAFTVLSIKGVHFGSGLSSPSIVGTLKHGTDRTSGSTIEAVTVTSSTTGTSDDGTLTDATVPANSFIWIETGSKSGTTDNFTIIVRGTYD